MPTHALAAMSARPSARLLSKLLRLATIIAVHIALLIGIATLDPEIRKKVEPLFVSLITPPAPVADPPPPPPAPPQKAPPPKVTPQPAPLKPTARQDSAPTAITTELTTPVAVPPEPIAAPQPQADVRAAPTPAPSAPEQKPAPVVVVPPRFDAAYLNNPPPRYPRVARLTGAMGKVMLRVYVSAQGAAEKVEIRTSSGSLHLDQAAREAVERWKFVPARQGDEPVAAWVLVPITFVLEG